MADNSILNNSYVVGIGGKNLVLNTFGRVYVKVQDKYYELNFKNSSSGRAGSSEIIIVDTKDAVQTLPYPGDHSFILTKDGFIYYTENNNFIPFEINSDGIKLVNPHIIGTITIDCEGKTPFVINSKTLVKNLNAEYLNGHNSDEFALLSENETVTGLWSFINEVFVQNKIYGTEAELDFATGRLVVNELIVKNGSAYTSYFEVDDYNNLYAKDERGIYSNSFISCKGLDTTAVGTFGYATEAYVNSEIAKLINGAPETLDTLGELAQAIGNNQSGWEALEQSIVQNTEDIRTLKSYFSGGSANTAVSLKNTHTIWGNEFNGTQDVYGHMYNVGNINFSNGQILTPTVSGYLHLNRGFVSDSFISCRGLDTNAAINGTIINSLGDITDVQITSPTNGQGLIYRDGVWVNEVISGGGSGDYLPIGGGTIDSTNSVPLKINTSNSTEVVLQLSQNGQLRAIVGYDIYNGSYIQNGINNRFMGIADDGTPYYHNGSYKDTILHSGNYSDYALPKSGGTIEGDLSLNQYLRINAWSGYGSGSANVWYNGTTQRLLWENVEDMAFGSKLVLHSGNYSDYALPKSGGTMANNAGIGWNNNVHSWDAPADGLECISTLNDTLGYYAGLSYKGFYGLQIRAYGGDTDYIQVRGFNHANWGTWRDIIHSGNIGSYGGNIGAGLVYFQRSGANCGYIGLTSGSNNDITISTESSSKLWLNGNGNTIMNYYGGNVLIGTTTDTGEKLRVAGSFSLTNELFCGGWLRTYDDRGWYNETYGGGIHMTDTNFVKTYGDKGMMSDFYSTSYGKSGTISEVGANWYRIAKGGYGVSMILTIGKNYFHQSPDTQIYAITIGYYQSGGITLLSRGTNHADTNSAIRISRIDSNNYAIDVLMRNSDANTDTWYISGLCSGNWVFQAPELVTDSPYVMQQLDLTWGVGFHTSNSMNVNGNLYASGGITARYASDIRLKEDIKTISTEVALQTIMALNPITFRWNRKATELCSWLNGESQGFIAQEYESLIPNSGSEMWGEYRGIDYNRAIPYIVVVEQNHESRIQQIVSVEQNHETRIRQLEEELQTLKREYYGNR